MLEGLPSTPAKLLRWSWQDIGPCYQGLLERPLDSNVIVDWFKDWSDLASNIDELHARLFIEFSRNTADRAAGARFTRFIETVEPQVKAAEHGLKLKLLSSGIEPAGLELALRKMRSETEIYRDSNLPLLAEEEKLCAEYDRVCGAQVVRWRGKEKTMSEMCALLLDPDRSVREASWRLAHDARAADRSKLNSVWEKLVQVRTAMAANAGCDDYRSYVWRQRFRFDYRPADCKSFHRAVEEVAVPAAARAYERRRRRLGIESARPWDTEVDLFGTEQIRPYETTAELIVRAKSVFEHIDPQIAGYFQTMLDAFQHWVYENPQKSIDTGRCDEEWCRLWDRFMPHIDYRGVEEAKELYWHRQLHIFKQPFYFIEYGFARLGAVQIWARSLEDYAASIASYKTALSFGSTASIPDLFNAAGAHFAFDRATHESAVGTLERAIDDLLREL